MQIQYGGVSTRNLSPKTDPDSEMRFFAWCAFAFQVALIVLYAVFLDYNWTNPAEDVFKHYYYMRDIAIMILFGFGFLMVFLRRYAFSAVGYCLLASVFAVQWSLCLRGFFMKIDEHGPWEPSEAQTSNVEIGLDGISEAFFAAGACMITYGAILGKVSPLQMLILSFVEPLFYWLNVFITEYKLHAVDIGGGMRMHAFGAYFAMPLAVMLSPRSETAHHRDNKPSYIADIFSYAGTIWLWMMWPSFNAVEAPLGGPQFRAIVNTLLGLMGSTVSAFIFSKLVSDSKKFELPHIQNSTLAGGVAMGVAAHYNLTMAAALAIGFIAGALSVWGYHRVSPWLEEKFGLQDVAGVHNLHGMPGVLSGIVGIFASLHASTHTESLYPGESEVPDPAETLFPTSTPPINSIIPEGDKQPGLQCAALFISIALGLLGGYVCGQLQKSAYKLMPLHRDEFFADNTFWTVHDDQHEVAAAADAQQHAQLLHQQSTIAMTQQRA